MKDIAGVQNQASNILMQSLFSMKTRSSKFSAETKTDPIAVIVLSSDIGT